MSCSLFDPILLYQALGSIAQTSNLSFPVLLGSVLTAVSIFSISYLLVPRRPSVMVLTTLAVLLTAPLLFNPILALDKVANAQLNANLLLATNFVAREAMLQNSDYFFDMASCPYATFNPGSVCNADKTTWPLLTNYPITVSQLNLGPCALLPAHLHRGDNVVIAINGTTHTLMFPEDGGKLVEQYLSAGQLTFFPAMSLHTMVNEGCLNNQLISFLPHNDASRVTAMTSLFKFGIDLVTPLLPFLNVTPDTWNATEAEIPDVGTGAIQGLAACRKKCGLDGNGSTSYGGGGRRRG